MSCLRQHPVSAVAYLLLMIFCILAIWLVRGIASGTQDGLVSRLANSRGLRRWVRENLSLRYSIRSVHVVQAVRAVASLLRCTA